MPQKCSIDSQNLAFLNNLLKAERKFKNVGLMDNIKQLGDMRKMQQQAQEVQKRLAGIKITVEHKGVTVVLTGDQKIVSIDGDQDFAKITDAVNEGLKQAQKVATDEMKDLMGSLGMPGM